jgi:hypothetical protein
MVTVPPECAIVRNSFLWLEAGAESIQNPFPGLEKICPSYFTVAWVVKTEKMAKVAKVAALALIGAA